mgnify:CR=1 FL=1
MRESVVALEPCITLVVRERSLDGVVMSIVPDLAERLEREAVAVEREAAARRKALAELQLLEQLRQRAITRDPLEMISAVAKSKALATRLARLGAGGKARSAALAAA